MTENEIRAIGKNILDSVPGGMDGPDVAQLAMLLISALVFQTPVERREGVIAQLKRGFQNAITEGALRGDLRHASKQWKQ